MWKILEMFCRARDRAATQHKHSTPLIPQISVGELANLCHRSPNRLVIFDLRETVEIEAHPYTVPGALLTIDVDLYALIPWIPLNSIVVLYASVEIPAYYGHIHLPPTKLKFYALEGGLRFWRDAGQPLERAVLDDRRSVDNR